MLLRYQRLSKIRTKPVIFEKAYYAQDSGTLELLRELSTKRKAIEESASGSSNLAPAIAKAMAGGEASPVARDLAKAEKYLPLLENLVSRVVPQNADSVVRQWTMELKLRWTGPLGYDHSNHYRIDDLRFEHAMVMWLYAALLRERALEVTAAGDLVEAASLYRRAAGVLEHVWQQILTPLQPLLPGERPPEATVSMTVIWVIVCLAEAQAVTAAKAEEKGSSEGLLAKLHYGVVEYLLQAQTLMKQHAGDWNDVSESFKMWLGLCSALHEWRCYRALAEEQRKQENLGMAIAFLRVAHQRMQQNKGPSIGNPQVWKATYKAESDALVAALRKCERENELIWRQKVPDLQLDVPRPEGKAIVTPIVFQPTGLDRHFVFHTETPKLK